MLSVDINEKFYLTVVLVDDLSMGSGESVSYTVVDSLDNPTTSGMLTESVDFVGTYSKEISLSVSGDYRVYYHVDHYPTGMEYVKVKPESLAELIKQNRQSNMSVENVFAVSDIPVRNVAIGRTDYIIVRLKADNDTDWSNPVVERSLYAWYAAMGDDQPIYMGEESK